MHHRRKIFDRDTVVLLECRACGRKWNIRTGNPRICLSCGKVRFEPFHAWIIHCGKKRQLAAAFSAETANIFMYSERMEILQEETERFWSGFKLDKYGIIKVYRRKKDVGDVLDYLVFPLKEVIPGN